MEGIRRTRAEDDPLVLVLAAFVLDCPAKVGDAELRRLPNRWQLHVVHEDDRAGAQQLAAVDEVEEDALEAVVAVDEREVERPPFGKQPRKGRLRPLQVELDEIADACLLERRDAHAVVQRGVSGEALELVRVDRDVADLAAVREQALADEERRDRVAEADLERLPRTFAADPVAQRRTFGRPDGDRRDLAAGQPLLSDLSDARQLLHHRNANVGSWSGRGSAMTSSAAKAARCVRKAGRSRPSPRPASSPARPPTRTSRRRRSSAATRS